jgi:hypothetical protein
MLPKDSSGSGAAEDSGIFGLDISDYSLVETRPFKDNTAPRKNSSALVTQWRLGNGKPADRPTAVQPSPSGINPPEMVVDGMKPDETD